MDKIIDILIPEIGGKIGKLVLEDLTSHGLNVATLDDSKFSKDIPKYIRELVNEVERTKPRMIFPIFKGEVISKHRELLPKDIIIPVCDSSIIHNLDDKVYTSKLCKELDINQPKLYTDEDIESIEKYPVVFKRSEGLGGSGVYFPKSKSSLEKLINTSKSHLIMDYIDGYDISVDAIRINGYFHAESYRIILPKGKGFSFVRKSIVNEEAIEITRKILDHCNYEGICGIDFRIENSGKMYFLECNPRFSGGLKSSIKSGFDIPYILYSILNKEPIEPIKYKIGCITFEKHELIHYIKERLKKRIRKSSL